MDATTSVVLVPRSSRLELGYMDILIPASALLQFLFPASLNGYLIGRV